MYRLKMKSLFRYVEITTTKGVNELVLNNKTGLGVHPSTALMPTWAF